MVNLKEKDTEKCFLISNNQLKNIYNNIEQMNESQINNLLVPTGCFNNIDELIKSRSQGLRKINLEKKSSSIFQLNCESYQSNFGVRLLLTKQKLLDGVIRRYILFLRNRKVNYQFGTNNYKQNPDYLGKARLNNNNVVAALLDILSAKKIENNGKIIGHGHLGRNRMFYNKKGLLVRREEGFGIQNRTFISYELRAFFKILEPFILPFLTGFNYELQNEIKPMKRAILQCFFNKKFLNIFLIEDSDGLLKIQEGNYYSLIKKEKSINAWEYLIKNYPLIANMDEKKIKIFYIQFCNIYANIKISDFNPLIPQWRLFLKNQNNLENKKIISSIRQILYLINNFQEFGYLTSLKEESNRLFNLNAKNYPTFYRIQNYGFILSISIFLQKMKKNCDDDIGVIMNQNRYQFLMFESNENSIYLREKKAFEIKNRFDCLFFGLNEYLGRISMDYITNYILEKCSHFNKMENRFWDKMITRRNTIAWILAFPEPNSYIDNKNKKSYKIQINSFWQNEILEFAEIWDDEQNQDFDKYLMEEFLKNL